MKLSKDFTLQELTKSEIADRNNINNIPISFEFIDENDIFQALGFLKGSINNFINNELV